MVNRKNKVAVIGKNCAFIAVISLAFLPIIFVKKIGGANLLRRNVSIIQEFFKKSLKATRQAGCFLSIDQHIPEIFAIVLSLLTTI